MANNLESQTSITLLERVARPGDADQAAWSQFAERYGRKVYLWCLHWKLQDADAEDVTQIVLLKLANRMKEFRYDPSRSFRAWLKTVAHHAWKDFVESKQRAVPGIGQAGEEWTLLSNIEARDDLVKGLEEQFDLELLEKALEAVRPRVAPNNWQAFCLTALEGMSANETAERLGMKIARVYAARSTIQQLLQQECRRLEGEQEPGG